MPFEFAIVTIAVLLLVGQHILARRRPATRAFAFVSPVATARTLPAVSALLPDPRSAADAEQAQTVTLP